MQNFPYYATYIFLAYITCEVETHNRKVARTLVVDNVDFTIARELCTCMSRSL
jgi:hypothetical protein